MDYPALFEILNRHYPSDTPVAVVCYAGDRQKQEIIRSTVGRFPNHLKYKKLPVHTLLVGKFLTVGQGRKDALVKSEHLLKEHP